MSIKFSRLKRYAPIAGLALFTFAGGAEAQVYKCERDGKTAFSDHPCEPGAKATRSDYAPTGGGGTVDLQVVVNYYEVRGRDRETLLLSLRAKDPRGYHGLASWNINYEFTSKRQQGVCRIDTAKVTVEGQILMPRWVDESAASPDLQRRWRDYYAALKLHEDGHIQNGRDLATLVREKLMGMGTVPCEDISALAQKEFDRLYQNLKSRDQDYDTRTNHGSTQGALF